ncbi:CapA family protein, partial [Patescibacteria group bacterium]
QFSPNSDPNSLRFTFDPKLIPELKKIGFNILNLANNHALDFGAAGFAQSKEYLKKNNFDYFGDPKNAAEISIIKNISGLKIGFIGFNGLIGKIDPVLEEIEKVKEESDIVAVYTHWGTEYNENFTQTQQDQARELIGAGADVIFGSHPHVVEPIEEYKGKIIFYSLGNFVFDQLFSEKTQQELAIGAVFKKRSMEYYLFPLESKNIQVNLLSGDKKDIILKELAEKSEASKDIKKQIQDGKIIVNY